MGRTSCQSSSGTQNPKGMKPSITTMIENLNDKSTGRTDEHHNNKMLAWCVNSFKYSVECLFLLDNTRFRTAFIQPVKKESTKMKNEWSDWSENETNMLMSQEDTINGQTTNNYDSKMANTPKEAPNNSDSKLKDNEMNNLSENINVGYLSAEPKINNKSDIIDSETKSLTNSCK
ncbi:hypothetical protein MAR_021532 [Mya arenaria]|uniref:Uncharacterized protein n=1 Tax=Mya arenaria TaxID=6604 RepID=A0ABY7E863_MYAAR|nr:hypothetical protein MAR_021532 [Mya arenaria]